MLQNEVIQSVEVYDRKSIKNGDLLIQSTSQTPSWSVIQLVEP